MAYECHGKFPVLRPSIKCPDPGWAIEIFMFLAESLRLEVLPVIADFPDDWGTHANGSHNDPLTYIEDGVADAVALFFQDTDDRRQRVSLTHPIYYVRPIFLVRKYVDNFENTFSFVRFLDVYTWVLMLIVCAAQYGLLLLAQSVLASPVRGTWHELMFHVFALQLRQSPKNPWTKSAAINCSLAFFCLLQAGILMSLFEGRTLGHLLQPVAKAPFKDVDEMLDSLEDGRYRLLARTRAQWYWEEMKHSNQTHFRRMRTALERYPLMLKSDSEGIQLVRQGRYAMLMQQDDIVNFRTSRDCDLGYVRNGLPYMSTHFVFAKNSTLVPMFNQAIIRHGDFIRHTYGKYLSAKRRYCDSSDRGATALTRRPLSVTTLYGAFIFASFGFSASAVIFLLERREPRCCRAVQTASSID